MSITIPSVPEYLTREQYVGFFKALGIDPMTVVEVRAALNGVHALVFALDEHGHRILTLDGPPSGYPAGDPLLDDEARKTATYQKHRIFIPVRDEPDDERTTRITP